MRLAQWNCGIMAVISWQSMQVRKSWTDCEHSFVGLDLAESRCWRRSDRRYTNITLTTKSRCSFHLFILQYC